MNHPFRSLLAVLMIAGMSSGDVFAETDEAPSQGLFKSLDKNGDGQLSREEVDENRQKFFDRLVRVGDANEDGKLSRDEFNQASNPKETTRPATEAFGGDSRSGMAENFFKQLDRNSDGKVNIDEVPERLRERLVPIFATAGKETLTLAEFEAAFRDHRPDEMFKRLDADGDGKITLAETPERARPFVESMLRRAGKDLDAALTKEDLLRVLRASAGERPLTMPPVFRALDGNRDGLISKEELGKAAEKFDDLDRNSDGQLDPRELFQSESDGLRERDGFSPRNLLQQFDRNGDGQISKEEAPERMKNAFDRLDKNGDGQITAAELEQIGRNRPREK